MFENIKINSYHEPFVGGGAVFFSMCLEGAAYLSDLNPQLVNAYVQIRDKPEDVINCLFSFPNTQADYYRIRNDLTADETPENAARFVFLNQTSFNGLYRVNGCGKYNVPYGFRKNWTYDVNRIRQASLKLQNVHISTGDFEINRSFIGCGDLVFLDPPYTVSHNQNGFIQYNQNLFSLDDQYRLKEFIEDIKNKGAYYVLTNAAHKTVREIFQTRGDFVVELYRNSLIGGRNAARSAISEYIFTNIPGVGNE